MTNFGIKVSQRGYDAATSKDYKLEYSSGFPMLPILYSGSFIASPGDTLITHSLGYVPMWAILYDGTSGISLGSVGDSFMCDNFINNEFDMDSTSLVRNSTGSGTITGRYYIFAIDLETNFTAPILSSGTDTDIPTSSTKFGIKVSKQGKDVSSTDLRDFTIHSGTRSPLIHSVTKGDYTVWDSTGYISIFHGLGYPPFMFFYRKYGTIWEQVPNQAVSTDTQYAYIPTPGISSDIYSLVLLKEPTDRN